ncbi:MAG TPA: hypothetical protein V6D29_21205 [Leptolyngbyaceae cyanobacterium]
MQQVTVVKNSLERCFLQTFIVIIPAVYAARALVEYADDGKFPYTLLDFSRILIELSLVLGLVFFKLLFDALPYTLNQLFFSSNVMPKAEEAISEAAFIKRFTNALNHPCRQIFGLIVTVTLVVYFSWVSDFFIFSSRSFWQLLDRLLTVAPVLVYAYFVGVFIWKFCVISYILKSLPEYFDVKPQFGHPDNAGGLLPVGLLCLKLINVPVVPTLSSAFLLVLGYLSVLQLSPANYSFIFGLLACGVAGSLVGLLPLLVFHQAMLKQQAENQFLIAQISARIVQLKIDFAKSLPAPNQGTVEDYKKDIEAYESFYQAHQHINTWPMNRKTLAELWATQTFLISQVAVLWNLANKLI